MDLPLNVRLLAVMGDPHTQNIPDVTLHGSLPLLMLNPSITAVNHADAALYPHVLLVILPY